MNKKLTKEEATYVKFLAWSLMEEDVKEDAKKVLGKYLYEQAVDGMDGLIYLEDFSQFYTINDSDSYNRFANLKLESYVRTIKQTLNTIYSHADRHHNLSLINSIADYVGNYGMEVLDEIE